MPTTTPHLSARRIAAVATSFLVLSLVCAANASAYGWPLKPFHRQHPVRGFFGDPRVDWEVPHVRRAYRFHFGIDISGRDGAPVYATASGRLVVEGETVSITRRDGVTLEYWHVVPLAKSGTWATAYRTVVGRIADGWGHVHFSESRNGAYVNPLRPGAMAPFADTTSPVVRRVRTSAATAMSAVTTSPAASTSSASASTSRRSGCPLRGTTSPSSPRSFVGA